MNKQELELKLWALVGKSVGVCHAEEEEEYERAEALGKEITRHIKNLVEELAEEIPNA